MFSLCFDKISKFPVFSLTLLTGNFFGPFSLFSLCRGYPATHDVPAQTIKAKGIQRGLSFDRPYSVRPCQCCRLSLPGTAGDVIYGPGTCHVPPPPPPLLLRFLNFGISRLASSLWQTGRASLSIEGLDGELRR